MNDNILQDSSQPSFSRNRPGIFCVTCLSTSDVRKMYPVGNKSFFSSITMIQVPKNSNFKVCWECHAMLEKIKRFRQKALKANYIMNKNKKVVNLPSPLTTLVRNNLIDWLSISYKNRIIDPMNENTPVTTSLKEEIIETEALETQDANLIEDPFLLHSELDIKFEDLTKENEHGCMDIIKCDYDSSSDDEPLITKAKTHEITKPQTDDGSDTDSATELPTQNLNLTPLSTVKTKHLITSTIEVPTNPSVRNIPESLPKPPSLLSKVWNSNPSSSLELPLAFVASSILTNNLPKRADSLTQIDSQERAKPIEYHSGPKLFKNSPQLAIPEMFRNIEPPKQPTYEIRRITQEQVNQYRADMLQRAKAGLWQMFCTKCLDKFKKPRDYEAHLKKHETSAGAYMCTICELRYPTQKELDEHKEGHFRLYVCDVCKLEFYNMNSVLRHNDLTHDDVVKFCRHCDKRFTNRKDYYKHNRTHIKPLKCKYCDKEMKRDKLKQHVRDHHDAQPLLGCDICHKMFEGIKRLRKHMRNSHGPNYYDEELKTSNENINYNEQSSDDGDYSPTDGSDYHSPTDEDSEPKYTSRNLVTKRARKTNLSNKITAQALIHVKRSDSTSKNDETRQSRAIITYDESIEEDPVLSLNEKSNRSLNETIKDEFTDSNDNLHYDIADANSVELHISDDKEDSGYCVECDASFKTQALYLAHLKTTMKHKNDLDKFSCPQCDRSFPTSWYLKKHINVQHENREVSKCDICQKTYQSKKAVRSHIMKQHLKLKSPSELRKKVCDFCGKTFTSKSCLRQHINSHLKIRPYKCEECGATFSYSGARYTHVKLKHKMKQAKETSTS